MTTHKQLRFSEHATSKLEILRRHGFAIDQQLVQQVVTEPDEISKGYGERKIAQKTISPTHLLRVVYEESEEAIVVITFYPARRKRYEKP